MPRFSDEWVIDRVLFDSVAGGSCACCGFQFFVGGTADLIGAVSDLETDQQQAEVNALQNHPWPQTLRDQVWSDRVRLRQKLKKEMDIYSDFWEQHSNGVREWCLENSSQLVRLWQLPRSEILEKIRTQYNIHSAYGVVLSAVTEQVAHFGITGYPPDGRGDAELGFEDVLQFDRRGGFTLPILNESGDLDEAVLETWLRQMQALGGPKLLERHFSNKGDGDVDQEEKGDADEPTESASTAAKSSFSSDRRLIRLLIARYFTDALMQRYLVDLQRDVVGAETAGEVA